MFLRPEHAALGTALELLDGAFLERCRCWFAGGSAIVLRFGEYRITRDLDFFVSDRDGYVTLRKRLSERGILGVLRTECPAVTMRDPIIDRVSIRTVLKIDATPVRLEIQYDPGLELSPDPKFSPAGIRALSLEDLYALKLLANADRHADPASASRDIVDLLAMERLGRDLFDPAAGLAKAERFYGPLVGAAREKAEERLRQPGVIETVREFLGLTPDVVTILSGSWDDPPAGPGADMLPKP